MEKVYILHHVYEYDDIEDVKLVGVFKTEKDAKIAINNLKKKVDLLNTLMASILMNIN